ncbi:CARDB protein [Mariprofundus ferrinatatus]|uniref:CARDB protein n=1 Tax=Mariprofundus ferrinatatus TaxID=1921087 RepID=A0A2K8L6Q9_9PROT|nr:CARDB domain-containing protein [Mariprofundus ferrinatatus]ATX82990.1 CARDB protein [Mariprofundus ferrinatatus]
MLNRSKPITASLFLSLLPLFAFPVFAQDIQWASDITLRPQSPVAGERATFQVTVRAGREAATGFAVVGGIDGKQLFKKELGELRADRSRNMRFSWRATAGSHKVYFRIVTTTHSRAAVPPELSREFTVQGGSAGAAGVQATAPARSRVVQHDTRSVRKPELRTRPVQATTAISPQTLSSASFQQPTCEGAPLPDIEALYGSGIQGGAVLNSSGGITVTLPFSVPVIVVNRGQCDTGIFSVKAEMRVQAQGVDKVVQLGSKSIHSLPPCRSKGCGEAKESVRFDFTPQYNHALYSFTIEADATHSIDEFNEDNNEIEPELRIDEY